MNIIASSEIEGPQACEQFLVLNYLMKKSFVIILLALEII